MITNQVWCDKRDDEPLIETVPHAAKDVTTNKRNAFNVIFYISNKLIVLMEMLTSVCEALVLHNFF